MKEKNKNVIILVIMVFVIGVFFVGMYFYDFSNTKNNVDIDNDNAVTDKKDLENKEELYKISVDNYDFWMEDMKIYKEKYTAKMDGEKLAAEVLINLYKDQECYYFSQVKFESGSLVTIQGSCTYNVENNILNVDGTYNKLAIPSAYEQSMGMTDTNSKEESHLEFTINSNGKSITAGKITYYNSTYSKIFERGTSYILVDKKGTLYDLTGKSIWNDKQLVLDNYNIIEVDKLPDFN